MELYRKTERSPPAKMYINSAYLNNSLIDFMDKSKPLIVGSCGTYHLFTRHRLPTYRPKGRLDFQILYVASGKAHFYFNDKGIDTVVPAGNMVVYRPREPQKSQEKMSRISFAVTASQMTRVSSIPEPPWSTQEFSNR